MQTITKQTVINYLLGKMPVTEEDDFLADCFSSDESTKNFEIFRLELIEKYLNNQLSTEDKLKFETKFLSDHHQLELFENAKLLHLELKSNAEIAQLAKIEIESERKPFSFSSFLVPVSALAILIVAAIFTFRLINSNEDEIAKNPVSPTPTASQIETLTPIPSISNTQSPNINNNSNNSNIKANLNNNLSNKLVNKNSNSEQPENVDKTKESEQSTMLTFIVSLGLKGSSEILKINKKIKDVKIISNFTAANNGNYIVQINELKEDLTDGKVISTQEIKVKNGKDKNSVTFIIPANSLENKEYVINFSEKKSDGSLSNLKANQAIFKVRIEE